MRVPLFFTLSYLIVAVWAAGYAGCLERVWLYQAYLIDELNHEADRTVGYKCAKWDQPKKVCIDNNWKACKQDKTDKRCRFIDLIFNTGKLQSKNPDWEVKHADGSINVEETAKECVSRYTDKTKYHNCYGTVFNFPGYTTLKGSSGEWNDFVKKLGDVVAKTAQSKKTDANKKLFEHFDATMENILIARAGDHGKYAIPLAEADLQAHNVVKKDLGVDPLSTKVPPEHWFAVDWPETKLRAMGNDDLYGKISRYHNRMYGTGEVGDDTKNEKKAKDHNDVINSYKQLQAKLATCT